MFNVGDIVYISEDANSDQLDHSETLHPGDGPFTINSGMRHRSKTCSGTAGMTTGVLAGISMLRLNKGC